MSILRFRLTAPESEAITLLERVESEDCVEHMVEANELMSGMHEDSSSAGLPDDQGPMPRHIELHLVDGASGGDGDGEEGDEARLKRLIETLARATGAGVEFVDEF